MRDRLSLIRDTGAELVVVGNGSPLFALGFRDDLKLDCPLLVDPELRSYRAAGLRRGRVEVLSPRLPLNAVRALWKGHRQTSVQGDPWQLGGVFVIGRGGELLFQYRSREAGDHPPVEAILSALSPGAASVSESEEPSKVESLLGRGLSILVDPTVVLSFTRPGFTIHSLTFGRADLDVDLSGRRCLITGANQGLGYETALGLADLGADVVLLCRSMERGEEAAERIREQTGNARVRCKHMDVSDLASVRPAAERLAADPIHVLVHNAGVLPAERMLSPQGAELTFATHVAGPHLLTKLLAPHLAPHARVIWVSSGGMYTQKLNLEDLNWEHRKYDGMRAYAETKRAQVVLSELWAEALSSRGVHVNAMHPGWADTSGVRTSIPGFHRAMKAILRTPAEGADTIVWLAASEAAGRSTGQFFFDRAARATHYLPFTAESAADRQALWALCERTTDPFTRPL